MKFPVIIIIVSLFILSGCAKEEKTKEIRYSYYYDRSLPVLTQPLQFSGDLYGEWKYSFPFYESALSLYRNGRFYYYNAGCVSKTASAGTWMIQGAQIVLNSDKEYAEKKAGEYIVTDEPEKGLNGITAVEQDTGGDGFVADKKRRIVPFHFSRTNLSFSSKSSGMTDTANVYFVNERFILRGGRLYRNYVGSEEQYQKQSE